MKPFFASMAIAAPLAACALPFMSPDEPLATDRVEFATTAILLARDNCKNVRWADMVGVGLVKFHRGIWTVGLQVGDFGDACPVHPVSVNARTGSVDGCDKCMSMEEMWKLQKAPREEGRIFVPLVHPQQS